MHAFLSFRRARSALIAETSLARARSHGKNTVLWLLLSVFSSKEAKRAFRRRSFIRILHSQCIRICSTFNVLSNSESNNWSDNCLKDDMATWRGFSLVWYLVQMLRYSRIIPSWKTLDCGIISKRLAISLNVTRVYSKEGACFWWFFEKFDEILTKKAKKMF